MAKNIIKNMIVLFTLLAVSHQVQSSQIEQLNVDKQAEVYSIRVVMNIDAPVDKVRDILTDFDNLDRLNQSITSSRVISSDDEDTVRVFTRFENCVLFFCVEVQKVEDITEDHHGRIKVSIIPESSNFRSGHATWEIQETANGSRVIHVAKLEPELSIPEWLGASYIEETLREELHESFMNLECLSRTDCKQEPEIIHDHEENWDDEIWES